MRLFILLCLLSISLSAKGIDLEPYDHDRITEAEFLAYRASAAEELGSTHRAYPSHFLELYSDESLRASIAFTMPGHPAHPAWVTRYVAMDDSGIYMNVIGYFAGDESEFAKLYKQYEAMAAETTKKFQQ